jgi:excisionase family DNA binding protein
MVGGAEEKFYECLVHYVMNTNSIKRLFSIPEAATYLGRSVWSIRRLIWNGDLPQVRARGRVHLDVRDMDEFIDSNKEQEVA